MSHHSHTFDQPWPFAEPENSVAFCCEHVLSSARPILYVAHDHDGDWQFLCGDLHPDNQPSVICLGCMVEKDRTLLTLADLPVGWGADRDHADADWYREEDPPEEETDD